MTHRRLRDDVVRPYNARFLCVLSGISSEAAASDGFMRSLAHRASQLMLRTVLAKRRVIARRDRLFDQCLGRKRFPQRGPFRGG